MARDYSRQLDELRTQMGELRQMMLAARHTYYLLFALLTLLSLTVAVYNGIRSAQSAPPAVTVYSGQSQPPATLKPPVVK